MMSLGVPLSLGFSLFMLKESLFLSTFFALESVSFFILCILPLISILIFSPVFSFSSSKELISHFSIFILVFVSLSLCFCSMDPFFFLIFMENCAILMLLFIILFSKDVDKISSSFLMFFFNTIPSILFMFFCIDFSYSVELWYLVPFQSLSLFIFLSFFGILVSKLPLFLFHFWLSKAHVSASGCGSMVLASVMLKLGSMGLIKFHLFFLFLYPFFKEISFSFVTLFSSILLVVMVRFFDLKYLIACSSIIHMSPIFCLTLSGSSSAIMGACLMQVGHGLVSCFIFYLITFLYEVSYHRSLDQNKNFSGSSPLIFFCMFSFFLLNLGFPPFCSFISELYFLYSFLNFSIFVFFTFCVSLIFSGIFFYIVVSKSIFGKKSSLPIYFTNSYLYLIFTTFFFFFIFLPFFFY